MYKKLGLLGLIPLTITSCGWEPEYDEEFIEISDGIYKEYSEEETKVLNDLDDNSLVNILVTQRGAPAIANHAFESDFGIEHFIHGTGFIIHEDQNNYYVATNYHVVSDYIKEPALKQIIISKANELDNLEGEGPITGDPYDVNSDRAIVYGDKVLFTGNNVDWGFPYEQGHHGLANPNNRKIDLTIMSVPKLAGEDGFDDGYSAIPLADPIELEFDASTNDVEISELYDQTSSWNGYTVGFPAGYKRMNKGQTGELQIISGDSVVDSKNSSYDTISGNVYWQQNWYYKFFQAGGSSGSPIVNIGGELITLLASGYNYDGTEWTGGVSLNEVNAAICNSAELLVMRDAGHCTTI